MTRTELIKQAIESAKCRIYKLNFDLEGNLSAHHQKKANNQKELMEITVEALEKQIPKKPRFYAHNYYCTECGNLVGNNEFKWQRFLYCDSCGQAIDWEEGGTSDD